MVVAPVPVVLQVVPPGGDGAASGMDRAARAIPGPPSRRWARDGMAENAFFENAFSKNAFFENFANFWRARSRLYQNEILQENMRLTTFFKLYKICILLHRCNLSNLKKQREKKEEATFSSKD